MMPNFLRKDRDEKREKSLSIYAFCLNVIPVAGRGKGCEQDRLLHILFYKRYLQV